MALNCDKYLYNITYHLFKGRKHAIFCKRSPAAEKHAVFQGHKMPVSINVQQTLGNIF
jgi:hypothetical protein